MTTTIRPSFPSNPPFSIPDHGKEAPSPKVNKYFTWRNITLGLLGAGGAAAYFYATKGTPLPAKPTTPLSSKLVVPQKSLDLAFVTPSCGLKEATCKRDADRFIDIAAVAGRDKTYSDKWKIENGDLAELRDHAWRATNGFTDYHFELNNFYPSDSDSKFTNKLLNKAIESFEKSSIAAVIGLAKLGWLNESYNSLANIQKERASYLQTYIELGSIEHMEKLDSLWKETDCVHTKDQKSEIRAQFLQKLGQKSLEGSGQHMEKLHSLWINNPTSHTEDDKKKIRQQFFQKLYENAPTSFRGFGALKDLINRKRIQELGGDPGEATALYFKCVREIAVNLQQKSYFSEYLEAVDQGRIAVGADEKTKFIQEYHDALVKLIEKENAFQSYMDNLEELWSKGLVVFPGLAEKQRLQRLIDMAIFKHNFRTGKL